MMTPRLSRGFSARARNRALRWLLASSFAVTAIVVGSCNLHNPGVTAPDEALSYPSGLALSREDAGAPKYLYVANSNFDLRYNSGSLQAYDLEELERQLVANDCLGYGKLDVDDAGVHIDSGVRSYADNTHYGSGAIDSGLLDASLSMPDSDAGVLPADDAGVLGFDAGAIELPADYDITARYGNARGFLCDGRDPGVGNTPSCCYSDKTALKSILHSRYEMDSFAVGVAVSPDNKRVYVPLSSRNQLVYFDVDAAGNLGCDGASRCRRGPSRTSKDNVPDDDFPGQLSEITIGTLRDLIPVGKENGIDPSLVYMATTHELGAIGLFVVPMVPDPANSSGPLISGAPILNATVRGLGPRPRSIWAEPRSNLLYVTSAGEPFISRVGLRVSDQNVPGRDAPRELIYESTRITVSGVSQANDLRDLAVDPVDPKRLYVLIRGTQESVGFLDVDSTLPTTNARLIDEVRIGAGPSKLNLIQQDGQTFLLVTCYDEKAIYVVDAATHLLVAVVRSFSGPFTMVYDPARELLYVSDFRASILRVVDLKGLTDRTEPPPRIVATIGSPQFEGALQ